MVLLMMFLQNLFEKAAKCVGPCVPYFGLSPLQTLPRAHFDAPYILWFLLGKVNNYRINFLWFSYNLGCGFLCVVVKNGPKRKKPGFPASFVCAAKIICAVGRLNLSNF
jgi:hypothetical protein